MFIKAIISWTFNFPFNTLANL